MSRGEVEGRRKFLTHRDTFDSRDYHAVTLGAGPASGPVGLRLTSTRPPSSLDLTEMMPSIFDQGSIGSCTAHASIAVYTAIAIQLDDVDHDVPQSRLAQYYNTRIIEGTTGWDAGASIRSAMAALKKYGTGDERLWPYIESKIFTKPSAAYYANAKLHKITYLRVTTSVSSFKNCLVSGSPIVLGITCFDEITSDHASSTGFVGMPANPAITLGGHAIVIVGYDDTRVDPTVPTVKGYFKFRNSWGTTWGDPSSPGYGYLPYAYIQYCFDSWKIATIT